MISRKQSKRYAAPASASNPDWIIREQSGVGALAIIDDDRLVGIVTDRDLVRRGLAKGLDPIRWSTRS